MVTPAALGLTYLSLDGTDYSVLGWGVDLGGGQETGTTGFRPSAGGVSADWGVSYRRLEGGLPVGA